MTAEKKKCVDCGTGVEKSCVRGSLRCDPCGARYRATTTQKRQEGRLKIRKMGALKFKGMGTSLPVFVEDVSYHGARIRYTGDVSLFYDRRNRGRSNLVIDVRALKLHTFVKVVWTAPVNKKESRAGLRLIWHS